MTKDRWGLVGGFALLALAGSPGALAAAAALPVPALLPGEILMETANGCYVIATSAVLVTRRARHPGFGKQAWTGACPSGLATGKGTFGTETRYRYHMKNGRYLNSISIAGTENAAEFMEYADVDGQYVLYQTQGDPYVPNWNESDSYWLVGPDGRAVRTVSRGCYGGLKGLPSYEPFETNCREGWGTAVAHGVQVGDPNNPSSISTTWCSWKYKIAQKKCDQAWNQLGGPIVASVKAFRERHAQVVADIASQSAPLAAAWETQWPAVQVAREQAKQEAAVQVAANAKSSLLSMMASADANAVSERKAELAAVAEEKRRVASEAHLPAPRFRSVCMRNFKKMENVLYGNPTAASTFDLWLVDIAEDGLRILEPCVASDPDAAYEANRGREQIQKIRQYCAGAHATHECLPWGYQGVISDGRDRRVLAQTYTRLWHAEAEKAQRDPNYSADLGRAGGPRPKTTGAYAVHEQCRVAMHELGDRMELADKQIPASDIVHRSELILWYTMEAKAAIARICPASEPYQSDSEQYQITYDNVLKTCNQVSTTTCEPRIPGA